MPGHYGASLHQERTDAMQAQARKDEARKRLFKPPPVQRVPLPQTENQLTLRVAEEMDLLRRSFDDLADRLSSDPIVLQRHFEILQRFDILGQTLGHLSCVISAENPLAAVDRIGMDELRKRLGRRGYATT